MELLQSLIDICLHLDKHLNEWAGRLDSWLYALLFAVIFCETGLVVTPFLPGDSLLFAVGALAATDGSPISLWAVAVLMSAAAIIGDAVNYSIGYSVGPRVFHSETSRLLNRRHLQQAHEFYEKYGGKTIILARFIPIIRTFAPFVAGIGRMTYFRFAMYNVTGGIAWVLAFLLAGYWFGNREIVKRNFMLVIVAIIVISVLPAIWEYWRARQSRRVAQASGESAGQVPANSPTDAP